MRQNSRTKEVFSIKFTYITTDGSRRARRAIIGVVLPLHGVPVQIPIRGIKYIYRVEKFTKRAVKNALALANALNAAAEAKEAASKYFCLANEPVSFSDLENVALGEPPVKAAQETGN